LTITLKPFPKDPAPTNYLASRFLGECGWQLIFPLAESPIPRINERCVQNIEVVAKPPSTGEIDKSQVAAVQDGFGESVRLQKLAGLSNQLKLFVRVKIVVLVAVKL